MKVRPGFVRGNAADQADPVAELDVTPDRGRVVGLDPAWGRQGTAQLLESEHDGRVDEGRRSVHERIGAEVARPDDPEAGQGMVPGGDQDHVELVTGDKVEPFVARVKRWAGGEAHLGLPRSDRLDDLRGPKLLERDMDLGSAPLVLDHAGGQVLDQDPRGRRDDQSRGVEREGRDERMFQRAEAGDQWSSQFGEHAPRRRRHAATRVCLDQLHAKATLQRVHLRPDGRMREPQRGRRRREASQPDCLAKAAQLLKSYLLVRMTRRSWPGHEPLVSHGPVAELTCWSTVADWSINAGAMERVRVKSEENPGPNRPRWFLIQVALETVGIPVEESRKSGPQGREGDRAAYSLSSPRADAGRASRIFSTDLTSFSMANGLRM